MKKAIPLLRRLDKTFQQLSIPLLDIDDAASQKDTGGRYVYLIAAGILLFRAFTGSNKPADSQSTKEESS